MIKCGLARPENPEDWRTRVDTYVWFGTNARYHTLLNQCGSCIMNGSSTDPPWPLDAVLPDVRFILGWNPPRLQTQAEADADSEVEWAAKDTTTTIGNS